MKREDVALGTVAETLAVGELSPSERNNRGGTLSRDEMTLVSARDEQLRATLERQRDEAAQYALFEHDEMRRTFSAMAPGNGLATAAANFADGLARYLIARERMERMGFEPGRWPEWYAKLRREALEAAQ